MSAREFQGALGGLSRPSRAPQGSRYESRSDEKNEGWDDPKQEQPPRRGIVSLRPLQTSPLMACSQDVRVSGLPQSQNNRSRPKPKPFRATNYHDQQPSRSPNKNNHVSLHIDSTPSRDNAEPPGKCELVDSVGVKDLCVLLASIRGCTLQKVRSQLTLCVSESNYALRNGTTWAFLLPTGELFLLEETKPLRSPKSQLTLPCRLFGKPLAPSQEQTSPTSFALYAFEDSALAVLEFLERVLAVVFLDRDVDPTQPYWNRERVPGLTERLKCFLSGPSVGPGDEKLITLVPRSPDIALEADQEIKSSTVAALGRIEDDAQLPSHRPVSPPPAPVESDDDDDEAVDYPTITGSVHSFPGYSLTVPEEHLERRRALAGLVRDPTSNLLVFRNHYTAIGPESRLQLREAGRILSSSPLALTAGCSHSSQISEALSAELLLEYGLRLHKTEMELTYVRPSPIIDFTCTQSPSGAIVGVSVTRAFKGGEREKKNPFSKRVARALVAKKLNGLNKAWESIKPEQRWRAGLLHVWAPSARNAALIEAAFRDYCASSALATPVALMITSTSFDCPIAYAYIYNHFS